MICFNTYVFFTVAIYRIFIFLKIIFSIRAEKIPVTMKKAIQFMLLIACTIISAYAQNPEDNGKALNLPFRKYGISIGNSYEFTGLRINLINKNVEKINGLNITGFGGENNLDARLT